MAARRWIAQFTQLLERDSGRAFDVQHPEQIEANDMELDQREQQHQINGKHGHNHRGPSVFEAGTST